MAVAGGTDLVRNLRLGVVRPDRVVSLARISELNGLTVLPDGGLRIGAMATMSQIASDNHVRTHFPALAEAAVQVGSPQVRNRATIGGNFCNASPCADTAPPTIVFDAQVVLHSTAGERRVPAADFMTGPGSNVCKAGEIVTAFEFAAPQAHTGSAYVTLTKRKALEITIVSATARVSLSASGGEVTRFRVCLGSVAPTPVLSVGAEKILTGKKPDPKLLDDTARAAAADVSPIDDLRAGAQYRRHMVAVLSRRALQAAWEGASS